MKPETGRNGEEGEDAARKKKCRDEEGKEAASKRNAAVLSSHADTVNLISKGVLNSWVHVLKLNSDHIG